MEELPLDGMDSALLRGNATTPVGVTLKVVLPLTVREPSEPDVPEAGAEGESEPEFPWGGLPPEPEPLLPPLEGEPLPPLEGELLPPLEGELLPPSPPELGVLPPFPLFPELPPELEPPPLEGLEAEGVEGGGGA